MVLTFISSKKISETRYEVPDQVVPGFGYEVPDQVVPGFGYDTENSEGTNFKSFQMWGQIWYEYGTNMVRDKKVQNIFFDGLIWYEYGTNMVLINKYSYCCI